MGRFGRRVRFDLFNAETVIQRRRDGELPDPQLIWMDLSQYGWQGGVNADLVRLWLDVDLADLLPRAGPGADNRSDRDRPCSTRPR